MTAEERPALPGEGWQPIATAPKNATHVEVWDGKEAKRAHFACDLSGEEQPPFGPAWFTQMGKPVERLGYKEMVPQPTHWRPLPAASDERPEAAPTVSPRRETKRAMCRVVARLIDSYVDGGQPSDDHGCVGPDCVECDRKVLALIELRDEMIRRGSHV